MILHSVIYKILLIVSSTAADTNAFSVFFHCVYGYYIITVIDRAFKPPPTIEGIHSELYRRCTFLKSQFTFNVRVIVCMLLLLQPNYSVFGGCIVPCVVDSDQNSSVSTLRAEVSCFMV